MDAITDSTSTASQRLPPHNAHLLRARCSGDTFIVCRRFSSFMSYLEDRHNTIQAGTTMLRHRDAFLYQRPSRYPVVVPFSTRQAGQEVSCRRTLSLCTSVRSPHASSNGLPYRHIHSDGCGVCGVPCVGNGQQGHLRDSRCHGMLQMKGKVRRMHEPPTSRDTNACFCDSQEPGLQEPGASR